MCCDYHRTGFINPSDRPILMVDRVLAALLCACMTIAATLYLSATLEDEAPREATPGGVSALEVGTAVVVEGRLGEVETLGEGTLGRCILTGPGGDTVRLFLEFPPPPFDEGDLVRVLGEVAVYRGALEVVVDNVRDIELMERAKHPRIPLAIIIHEPQLLEGVEPVVHVRVAWGPVPDARGEGHWYVVEDVEGAVEGTKSSCVAFVGPGLEGIGLGCGMVVDLLAAVRYDPWTGVYYLEVLGTA
jgi:hypothetical protein